MDGEKKSGRDGCWEELFGPRADSSSSDGEALDDSPRVVYSRKKLLTADVQRRSVTNISC